jgi:hypothetical protein
VNWKKIYTEEKTLSFATLFAEVLSLSARKGGHWNTNYEKDILKFHGIGLASSPKLRAALKEEGLSFKS